MMKAPPFMYCGVDLSGPFYFKERCSEIKWYRVSFACLASRAIHIEVVNDMDTNLFTQSFRRFMTQRGNMSYFRSDNGSNFVGAETGLLQARNRFANMGKRIHLQAVIWKVYERDIISARAILSALILTHNKSLNDKFLGTLISEAVMISRSLTVETILVMSIAQWPYLQVIC